MPLSSCVPPHTTEMPTQIMDDRIHNYPPACCPCYRSIVRAEGCPLTENTRDKTWEPRPGWVSPWGRHPPSVRPYPAGRPQIHKARCPPGTPGASDGSWCSIWWSRRREKAHSLLSLCIIWWFHFHICAWVGIFPPLMKKNGNYRSNSLALSYFSFYLTIHSLEMKEGLKWIAATELCGLTEQ